MSNVDNDHSGSNYTYYNQNIELPRVSSIPSSPREENHRTELVKNNTFFTQEDGAIQQNDSFSGVSNVIESLNNYVRPINDDKNDEDDDKTVDDTDDKPLFVPCPPSKPKPSGRIVRAQVHPKPRHQPREDQSFAIKEEDLSFNNRLPTLSNDDFDLNKPSSKNLQEKNQSSTPRIKSDSSINKSHDKKNNISRDQRLINQYTELLNERFRDFSSESETEGKDFTVSVSSLSSDEDTYDNTDDEDDNQLEGQTLTQEKFEPLYSLPIKKSKRIDKNSFNSILISNSNMGGSLHRTGSLPDLRSIADMSLKKVSHVSKNESEAESEPGAKIGYKFKPLPPIPGTSSNINNTGLYETIDGLSKLSKNAVTKTESIESNKRKTFKEIATILTLVPRLTTNSVRSRKNDHRLADISNYLPDKKLKIFVGTWNMKGTKFLPSSLDDFLLPPESIYLQDVYVIGTQEGTPFRREWQVRLQETFGPSHVLMQSSNFGVLQLSIFVRRELVWFCSSVEQDTIATRVGHKIKTKGALAMSFSIFGTSLCFITSHFTSDKEKLSQRINDYRAINRGIRLPVIPGTKNYENSDVTDRFDRVFWFGDFNFRIQKSRESVDRIMKRHARDQPLIIRELLTHDQLNEVFDRGKIFHGFKENEITFMPTYKFDVNTDVYDSSPKKRVPSWTDRIVYKSPQLSLLKCLYYNSCNTIKVSDHRPVYGIFESEVEPYKNNFQVHGATFDREVYVEANLRRNAPSGSQANSHVCTIL